MRTVRLTRYGHRGGGLIGHLREGVEWLCYTLERPWRDNEPFISCIPDGDYECVWEYSHKFGRHLYELKGVEGRTEIKFHRANKVHQLQGCIAPGMKLGPDRMPVQLSKRAELMLEARFKGEKFLLEVRTEEGVIRL